MFLVFITLHIFVHDCSFVHSFIESICSFPIFSFRPFAIFVHGVRCPLRSAKQIGTGSAGRVEEGFTRVGRDAPVVISGARRSGLADIVPPDTVGDDDFFSVSFSVLPFPCQRPCSGREKGLKGHLQHCPPPSLETQAHYFSP